MNQFDVDIAGGRLVGCGTDPASPLFLIGPGVSRAVPLGKKQFLFRHNELFFR